VNPATPPGLKRTCPACNRPVEPGFKFCEFCGTRIPQLSTCSKCGTRFIAPVKFCDLCGAPVILEVIPEPDELPEKYSEEDTGPAEYEAPEYPEEEISEPDAGELPELYAEDETPEYRKDEIIEPDTEDLLEKFGKEYSDDETFGSSRKPKFPTTKKSKAGKQSVTPSPSGPGSPVSVDDALFLSDKKPAPSKTPVNRTMVIWGIVVLAAIIAAVYFIVLPMFAGNGDSGLHSSVTVTDITNLPEPTLVNTIPSGLTGTPAQASGSLVPLPTEVIPSGQTLYFHVDKDPVTAKITVIFAGSAGVGSITSADVKVTHPNGAVATGIILPLKGVNEITLDGSKETDRLEIIAKMTSGETYRVRDELIPLWGG